MKTLLQMEMYYVREYTPTCRFGSRCLFFKNLQLECILHYVALSTGSYGYICVALSTGLKFHGLNHQSKWHCLDMIFCYIFHIKPHFFQNIIPKSILVRLWWIFYQQKRKRVKFSVIISLILVWKRQQQFK